MLLYITAEDVFGDSDREPRRARPRPDPPQTLAALYDAGMRHHDRRSVLERPLSLGLGFEPLPDWRLDRLVIRTALFCRERLGLEPGRRAAVFGRLSWLWPLVDFAALGFGASALGIEHDVPDGVLAAVLRDTVPRVIVASDGESAARLFSLRAAGRLSDAALVAEAVPSGDASCVALETLLELGGTLDTPERAQAFRACARTVGPEAEALSHVDSDGLVRLSHREAVARVATRRSADPARRGDLAYLAPPRATLLTRLAVHGFVGDGLTSTVIGREGRTADELAQLHPQTLVAGAAWLESACTERLGRSRVGLGRLWPRRSPRRWQGDGLRVVEVERPLDPACVRALAAANVRVVVSEARPNRAGH